MLPLRYSPDEVVGMRLRTLLRPVPAAASSLLMETVADEPWGSDIVGEQLLAP